MNARISFLAVLGIVLLTGAILLFMGRVPICECGYVKLWQGAVMSSENSQHLSDWYSFSHIIHGFGFYLFLWFLRRWFPLSFSARLLIAAGIEAGWEILENTDFVINRYRETTIALDYYGDSVINSVMDIVFMALGFFLAARLPVRVTVSLAVLMEIGVALVIRDNLILNIIMLAHPFRRILEWQQGG